ncbi:hypothetical protein GCM10020331_064400 [Ectobacillus funiculus]
MDMCLAIAHFLRFGKKEAYKSTAEISVYVHKDERGKGVARTLMQTILELAPDKGFHMIVAGITKRK